MDNMEQQNNQNSAEEKTESQAGNKTEAPKKDMSDVEKNKPMAIVGYIISILFFVPLISDGKTSPFARFHANQQLVLLIGWVVINFIGGMIPFLGWFLILPLGNIFLLILMIIGIINASNGEMKKLPIIGNIELIK